MNHKKTVLVTGSSRGIGLAIAEKFAGKSFQVVLNCKNNVELLQSACERLRLINTDILPIACDVSNYESVHQMFESICDAFGGVDILINNAGISAYGLFNTSCPDDWQYIIEQNLFSVLNCSHTAAPYMIHNKNGVIINISSIWGNCGASCEAVYSASKGAVNTFSKALAKELGPSGIRVNAIACGIIDTDMNAWLNEEDKNSLIDQIPLQRFGMTKEVAELAYNLAKNEYITGQVLTIDGGMN